MAGAIDPAIMDGYRPLLRGNRHMAVAGHYLAAQAALKILEAGGNAVDAGVAGGLVLGVVHSEYVNFAGVAPIMTYSAETRRVETISGLGIWPGALTPDLFQREHGGEIPEGVLRTVVPAAPCAWISALQRHGTISFAEAAAQAIDYAARGFVMYPFMARHIARRARRRPKVLESRRTGRPSGPSEGVGRPCRWGPHHLRPSSYPTGRWGDPYGSLSPLLGISHTRAPGGGWRNNPADRYRGTNAVLF